MKKIPVFLKILPTLAMLLAVEVPANAAEAGALPAPTETASAPVSGLPALQSSTTLPPDSSPFVPDGPEKQKRVKYLVDQITATYGLSFVRELPIPTWQPRIGKLYTLHKKLTDNDWQLLAEMYITLHTSDLKFIAGVPARKSQDTAKLDSAMVILLAMHGDASIKTLTAMLVVARQSPIFLDRIKGSVEFKSWKNLPEYKRDQQLKSKPPK